MENDAVVVELVVDLVDAILLDGDVPEADYKRLHRFYGRIIVFYRSGQRTGHGRRSRSVRILLISLGALDPTL